MRPHDTFQRRGDDLHCVLELPMTAAALGTRIPIDTLDGVEHIEVRPGAQSGEVHTLRGKGVTHLRGSGRGDMIAQLKVATPTRLTGEQEDLVRRLAALRGEEQPTGSLTHVESAGLFGKLRDAFRGK